MSDLRSSTGSETLYRRIELGDGHVSYEPVLGVAQGSQYSDKVRAEMIDLASEFEGEAKANVAMGDKAEATKCQRAAYALRTVAASPQPDGNAYTAKEPIAFRVTAGNNSERHLFENKRDAQLMRDELEENGWLDVALTPLYAVSSTEGK